MAIQLGEVNFDGLVGPTHNYAGLSYGNVASTEHRFQTSNPKAAALQGLQKMQWVAAQGIEQAILPPHFRPNLQLLRELGFTGTVARMVDAAWREDPILLATCYSASSMWTANAATVSPSPDCGDGLLHFSPANLISGLHRSLEATESHRILQAIFSNESFFHVHPPLPAAVHLSDEGAANHTRLCDQFGNPGVELFVYGRDAHLVEPSTTVKRFPERQTLQACQAIARRHHLRPEATLFVPQSREAIDAGVFHNDVISVGHRNTLLYHQQAFAEGEASVRSISERYHAITGTSLNCVQVTSKELSLDEAVSTYLFNSQLITRPGADDDLIMLCPTDCEQNENARACLDRLVADDNPIREVHYLDLRQSMNNGGGPACLRLRVAMTPHQIRAMHQGIRFNDDLFSQLVSWVEKHYRDELKLEDLRDPHLVDESRAALDELSTILKWPAGFLVN